MQSIFEEFFNSTTALLLQRFPVETPQLCVQEVTGFQPYVLLEYLKKLNRKIVHRYLKLETFI